MDPSIAEYKVRQREMDWVYDLETLFNWLKPMLSDLIIALENFQVDDLGRSVIDSGGREAKSSRAMLRTCTISFSRSQDRLRVLEAAVSSFSKKVSAPRHFLANFTLESPCLRPLFSWC
jgi:hypothetical protein